MTDFNRFKTFTGAINELLPFESSFLTRISKHLDGLHEQAYRRYIMTQYLLGFLGTIKKIGNPITSAFKILLRTKWDDLASFMYNTLMIGCMHFQDLYSIRTARTERCIVHYGVYDRRDGKVKQFPFCTYNAIHRPIIEKALATPISNTEICDSFYMPKKPMPAIKTTDN